MSLFMSSILNPIYLEFPPDLPLPIVAPMTYWHHRKQGTHGLVIWHKRDDWQRSSALTELLELAQLSENVILYATRQEEPHHQILRLVSLYEDEPDETDGEISGFRIDAMRLDDTSLIQYYFKLNATRTAVVADVHRRVVS